MSDASPVPESPVFTLRWLAPSDVKDWLRLNGQDASDDVLIHSVCASAEIYAERCRPEFATVDPSGFAPDAECYLAAKMYAAKLYRRRNSPAGIETFGETTSFISRFDVDIDRGLHTGDFAGPIVA